MHVTAVTRAKRRGAGGFSLLEAVIAAGILLTTVAAVSLSVGAGVRATARLERTMSADRAVRSVAERLRSLPYCAASPPAAPAGGAATDLVAAVFPHALAWKNTARARFVHGADPDAAPGAFVTVWDEGGVEVGCTATFLRGAAGPRLSDVDLAGWDVEQAAEPPAPALEVVVRAVGPGGVRTARLVLCALAPALASDAPEDEG